MKKLANVFMILGVGIIAFSVSYSMEVHRFDVKETAVILFASSIWILLGILIHSILDKKKLSREKFYSRMVALSLYFTSITYYLIKTLL